jgi:AcrR family transcriptional regulator
MVTRNSVIVAAREVLARSEQSTMEEVALAARISLRTLYRLFKSRDELLVEVGRDGPIPARERVLEAAFELLGRRSLVELSMDDVAAVANVSRATLYRLFPGKAALFKALIEAFSPWEPIVEVLETMKDDLPEQVIPAITQELARALDGRTGVLLRMVFEMIKGEPDAMDGVQHSLSRGLPNLIQYLGRQMAAGHLRRMHPILAFQLLAGPVFVHLATRPLAAMMGFKAPSREVVRQIALAWLRAMAPGTRGP